MNLSDPCWLLNFVPMSEQGPIILGGRYELQRRLARGGMAEVFLAQDQLLGRPVAVKVLFPEFATDPAFVERFPFLFLIRGESMLSFHVYQFLQILIAWVQVQV